MPHASRRDARLLPLGVACLLLPSAIAGAEPSPACDGPVAVTLIWYDVFDQLADGGAIAAQEVQRRFCDLGLRVDWRSAAPGSSYPTGDERLIPVVVLQRHPLQRERPRLIMGEVPAEPSEGSRPIRLYLDAIRIAMGRRYDVAENIRAHQLSLALGRVATHELVHCLAPAEDHSSGGLMRGALSQRQLLGADVPISKRHASAVRAALAPGGPGPGRGIWRGELTLAPPAAAH